MLSLENKRILVTGASGFLGNEVVNTMRRMGIGDKNTILGINSKDFDLMKPEMAAMALKDSDIVINLAANVGGIGYNRDFPGKLFYSNITMGVNVIEAARINDIEKLVQIGTVCSYPKIPPHVPFLESDLWSGFPEETNAPYGIAKKALMTMGDSYRAQYGLNVINLLVVNLYGPNDNFDEKNSHVIPALIRKICEAKEKNYPYVTLWGTGQASREFLYVSDAAEGIILATENYDEKPPINIGSGSEIRIKELAEMIRNIIGYKGTIKWDTTMPDGQPRRVLDTSLAQQKIGFLPKTNLYTGLNKVIRWYLDSKLP